MSIFNNSNFRYYVYNGKLCRMYKKEYLKMRIWEINKKGKHPILERFREHNKKR